MNKKIVLFIIPIALLVLGSTFIPLAPIADFLAPIGEFTRFLFGDKLELILYNETTHIALVGILITAFVLDGLELIIKAHTFSANQPLISKFRAGLEQGSQNYDPDLTIILPAYRNPLEVERSVQYLLKAGVPRKKIVVVDDYSNDKFETATRAAKLGVRVLSIGRNSKKVGAVNVGLDAVDTKYVMVLDSDCVLLSSYSKIARVIQEMEILGLDGMAGRILPCLPASESGMKLYSDKKSILLDLQYLEYDQAIRLGRGAMYALQRKNGSYSVKYADVLVVSGAFGIFRRTVLRQAMSNIKEESILAEDAERTLKILGKNGMVGYADDILILTSAKLDLSSHYKQRVDWAAGFFRTFVSRFGASVCKRKVAGATYLLWLVRDILIHPLRLLSIPFLLLYPLEFLSLIAFYYILNISLVRKVDYDITASRTILALMLFYKLYMAWIPTTIGYATALVHELKLHMFHRTKRLPPIDIVQTWNTPLESIHSQEKSQKLQLGIHLETAAKSLESDGDRTFNSQPLDGYESN